MRIDLGRGFSLNLISAAMLIFAAVVLLITKIFSSNIYLVAIIIAPLLLIVCFVLYKLLQNKTSSKEKS